MIVIEIIIITVHFNVIHDPPAQKLLRFDEHLSTTVKLRIVLLPRSYDILMSHLEMAHGIRLAEFFPFHQ